jgi:hypothetical protein
VVFFLDDAENNARLHQHTANHGLPSC